MFIFKYVRSEIRTIYIKLKWMRVNRDNNTYLKIPLDFNDISVGRCTYGALYVLDDGKEGKLSIGSFCSIADNVTFVLSSEHPLQHASTFPMRRIVLGYDEKEALSKGDIVVDDDVWIAQNAVILSGVHIGQGAVIAAGAVVSKDVPPYAIVGGVPAKLVKYRFDEPIRDKLLELDYSMLDRNFIEKNVDDLYKDISSVTDAQKLIDKVRRYNGL